MGLNVGTVVLRGDFSKNGQKINKKQENQLVQIVGNEEVSVEIVDVLEGNMEVNVFVADV